MRFASGVLAVGASVLGFQEPAGPGRTDRLRAWVEARWGVEVRWSRPGPGNIPEPGGEPPGWARQIKAAGARYVIFSVAESALERELLAALTRVCRELGLGVGVSLRVGESDPADRGGWPGAAGIQARRARLADVLAGCGPLDYVGLEGTAPGANPVEAGTFRAAAREVQPAAALADGLGGKGDLGVRAPTADRPWVTVVPLPTDSRDARRSRDDCIRTLVRTACANGNVLLGVRLGRDGRLDPVQAEILLSVGEWLRRYGESLCVTRGGPFPPEPWGGSTCEGETVYLHVLEWSGEELWLPGLDRRVLGAEVLTGGTARIRQRPDELEVRVPLADHRTPDTIVVLTLDGPAESACVRRPVPVSQGKRTRASSVRGGDPQRAPERASDGDERTGWAPEVGAEEAWIELDLGSEERVGRVRVVAAESSEGARFEIRREEGDSWTTIVSGGALRLARDLRFLPVRARRFRLVLFGPTGRVELKEVQFFRSDD